MSLLRRSARSLLQSCAIVGRGAGSVKERLEQLDYQSSFNMPSAAQLAAYARIWLVMVLGTGWTKVSAV